MSLPPGVLGTSTDLNFQRSHQIISKDSDTVCLYAQK